jgi:hypothetical protein
MILLALLAFFYISTCEEISDIGVPIQTVDGYRCSGGISYLCLQCRRRLPYCLIKICGHFNVMVLRDRGHNTLWALIYFIVWSYSWKRNMKPTVNFNIICDWISHPMREWLCRAEVHSNIAIGKQHSNRSPQSTLWKVWLQWEENHWTMKKNGYFLLKQSESFIVNMVWYTHLK